MPVIERRPHRMPSPLVVEADAILERVAEQFGIDAALRVELYAQGSGSGRDRQAESIDSGGAT